MRTNTNNTTINTIAGVNNMKSVNQDRDTVFTAIETSKRTHLPVLLLGGAGCGKTVGVNVWAEVNGYHVEAVHGSQYSRDEVLGFQTYTGKEHLEIMEPEWFSNIIAKENEGIPSILFLDELSAVTEDVQGALYQLIAERKIRSNKKLPDSTIVVSAGNYHESLPNFCNITAPSLNRFTVINCIPGEEGMTASDVADVCIDECFQDYDISYENVPQFNNYKMPADEAASLLNQIKNNFKILFKKYNNVDTVGLLDLRNQAVANLFTREDGNPKVYNFISKRTMNNFANTFKTLCEMGITSDNSFFKQVVDGLIGYGTNNWSEDEDARAAQVKAYLKTCYSMAASILDAFSKPIGAPVEAVNTDMTAAQNIINRFNTKTIAGATKNLMAIGDTEGVETAVASDEMQDTLRMIATKYPTTKVAETVKAAESDIITFRSDVEHIKLLANFVSQNKKRWTSVIVNSLMATYNAYATYYIATGANVTNDQL